MHSSSDKLQQCPLIFLVKSFHLCAIRDVDEMTSEASLSEEKAQRAMIDAARLADEVRTIFSPNLHFLYFSFKLRMEQECAQQLERDKKLLEAQVKKNFHFILSFQCQVQDILLFLLSILVSFLGEGHADPRRRRPGSGWD